MSAIVGKSNFDKNHKLLRTNSLEFRRIKKLKDEVFLIEDDKESSKVKYYTDNSTGNIFKTIEFKNSKSDRWERTKIFNSNGQIIKYLREASNKEGNNEYWETKEFDYNKDGNLSNTTIRFNNGDGEREHIDTYIYDNQQLVNYKKIAENNRELTVEKYKYDKIGNPIEIQTQIGTDTFEYLYDDVNNWIKMTRTHESRKSKNRFQNNYNRRHEYE